MIDKQTTAYLRLAHGTYNTLMLALFLIQAWLGFRIRKGRLSGRQNTGTIKRHRRAGPVLALMGVSGFVAGMVLVVLHEGRIFEHKFHFITGSLLALSIAGTFLVSRKIEGPDSYWRNMHYRLGLWILLLYLFQFFLGLGILL